MALPTNAMNVTTLNVFRPEIWSNKIMVATKSNLVFANKVWRFDEDVLEYGQTVHIPNLSNLTVHAKAANVEVNLDSNDPTETDVDLLINLHYECSFELEDIGKAQAKPDLQSAYTKQAVYAVNKQIDSNVAILAASVSQNVGDFNTNTFEDTKFLRAIQYLDDADAPQEDRHFVCKPVIKMAILAIEKYTYASAVGGVNSKSAIITGMFSELYGIPFSVSTNTYKTSNNTSNLLFQQQWAALAMQKKPRVQAQYQLKDLANLVVVDGLFGCIETRATFACQYKS